MPPSSHLRPTSGLLAIPVIALASGCTHTVKIEPIKVEPIDITLHIYLEADKKLDAFFKDVESPAAPSTPASDKPQGAKP